MPGFPWQAGHGLRRRTVPMDERSERIARRFEIPLLVAAALVIPAIWIEGSDLSRPWPAVGAAVDWAIWLAFAVEMVVMLRVVPDGATWLRKHPSLSFVRPELTGRSSRSTASNTPRSFRPLFFWRGDRLRSRRRQERLGRHLVGGHDGDHRGLREPNPGHGCRSRDRDGPYGREHRVRFDSHRCIRREPCGPPTGRGRTRGRRIEPRWGRRRPPRHCRDSGTTRPAGTLAPWRLRPTDVGVDPGNANRVA